MKVLLFGFAPGGGIAHAGVCAAVGAELAARGHEPVLAYGGDRARLLAAPGLRLRPVDEVPLDATGDRGRIDTWYPSTEDLVARARADLALIEEEAPAVVVTDTRLSAQVAADASGRPHVGLHHFLAGTGRTSATRPAARARAALRHPRAALRRAPELLRGDPYGAGLLHARLAEARAALGVTRGEARFFTGATATALTTTPVLDPAPALPESWVYAGPVVWGAAGGAVPPPQPARPRVFVSQGSIGEGGTLREIVGELAREPVHLCVAVMGADDPAALRALAPHAEIHEVADSVAQLAAADVAVLHGGHMTNSAAAVAGTPVVLLPDGRDHWAWADRVERLGTGIALPAPRRRGAVARAVRRVLGDPGYRAAAGDLAGHLRSWDGRARVADLVERAAAS